MKNRVRDRMAHVWLLGVFRWADGRIVAGDLDLDDSLYRLRDAAATLLEICFHDPRPIWETR